MQIKYLVTTQLSELQKWIDTGWAVSMVDGTVPGWTLKKGDLHFDHHKEGGKDIQIDEMPLVENCSILDQNNYAATLIVTTQIDADACVAATWLQLTKSDLMGDSHSASERLARKSDMFKKLRAIAYDCDHLAVPPELGAYGDFAAQCVAAMKSLSNSFVQEMGLPSDRKAWTIEQKEDFASLTFDRSTQVLINAVKGLRPFPGEQGEAKEYWEKVNNFTQMFLDESRLSQYRGAVIIDCKGLGGQYIDPRASLRVLDSCKWDTNGITLTQREIYSNDIFKGYSYTLAVVPLHSELNLIDYTAKGFSSILEDLGIAGFELNTFDKLTLEELVNDREHYTASVPDKQSYSEMDLRDRLTYLIQNKLGWGGRKTVGGSSWNTPSKLSPEQVIDAVLDY
jgi:hypothetical protein